MKRKKKIDLKSFYNSYISSLRNSLYKVDLKKISTIIDLLKEQFKKKKKIFICGNGGSAAIANHYICDYLKLLYLSLLVPQETLITFIN